MPLTKKGEKIERKMKQEYGAKKGEAVFYASINKGTVKGAEKAAGGKAAGGKSGGGKKGT